MIYFTAHTFKCVCHCIRTMFRVLGVYNFGFPPNLPELNLKLFCSDVQNNFKFSSGKFGGKHRNQQTIVCQVLAPLKKKWSCLILIKLYFELGGKKGKKNSDF